MECRNIDSIRRAAPETALLSLAAVLLAACGPGESPRETAEASPDDSGQVTFDTFAEAEVSPVGDSGVSGFVRFDQRSTVLEISGNLSGLAPGDHGLHVHETGDCSGAGTHFSPQGHPHGSPDSTDAEHHAGDLGNVTADANGDAEFQLADGEMRLGSGEYGINGRTIVVHAMADDLETQPDGNAGAAVGCAVIDPVPQPDYVPESP